MFPHIPLCYSVFSCVLPHYSLLPYVTLSYPMLPCVTLCYHVLPCVTVFKKLQLMQNIASRIIITEAAKFDHVTPLLRQLNWLSVKQQLYLRDAVMTYKCVYNLTPMYLSSNVNQRTTIHSRYTRNRNDLAIPLFRTVSGQRSFAYRLVKIWNDLKSPLKSSTSVATFRKKLRDSIQSADIVI